MDNLEQALKVNSLEIQVAEMTKKIESCSTKIDEFKKDLVDHMIEENLERRATDKKLNLHTILLVVVGIGATSVDLLTLIKTLI